MKKQLSTCVLCGLFVSSTLINVQQQNYCLVLRGNERLLRWSLFDRIYINDFNKHARYKSCLNQFFLFHLTIFFSSFWQKSSSPHLLVAVRCACVGFSTNYYYNNYYLSLVKFPYEIKCKKRLNLICVRGRDVLSMYMRW